MNAVDPYACMQQVSLRMPELKTLDEIETVQCRLQKANPGEGAGP